jgi:hypothetical protein
VTAAGGPFLAACILLVAAGVAKARQPAGTLAALALLGPRLHVPRWAVQLIGASEAVLGTTAVVTGSAASAVAVAACYLAFAGFVAASLARGTHAGCGCFGQAEGVVPLGRLHLVADVVMAVAAVWVAAAGGVAAGAGVAERIVVSAAAAALAWVVYLALVPLARLGAAVREPAR